MYIVSARQRLLHIKNVCFLFFRGHLPTPRGYSSAMSRRTRRGLNFSLLLFIFLLFMNG